MSVDALGPWLALSKYVLRKGKKRMRRKEGEREGGMMEGEGGEGRKKGNKIGF